MDEMERMALTVLAMQIADKLRDAGAYFLSMTLTAGAIALQANKEKEFTDMLDKFVNSLRSEFPKDFESADNYDKWLKTAGK